MKVFDVSRLCGSKHHTKLILVVFNREKLERKKKHNEQTNILEYRINKTYIRTCKMKSQTTSLLVMLSTSENGINEKVF